MNALGVRDEFHLEDLFQNSDYVAQEKLDGMRAVVHICKDGLRIFSRSASVTDPTRPIEKTDALPHLTRLQFPSLAGTIIDTEILLPGHDCAELSGTIHRKNGNGHNRLVKMFVFDVLSFCGKDITSETLYKRISYLSAVKSKLVSEFIQLLPYTYTYAEKSALYVRVLEEGGEGVMLKNLNASYVQGARPAANWYKAKKSATFDCVIMGFTKGKGKYNNHIGAVRFGQFVDGTLQELGQASGMTDEVRREMSQHPERYLRKVVTIKGMERLKSGAIRHPIYAGLNHDKDPHSCVWYQGEQ